MSDTAVPLGAPSPIVCFHGSVSSAGCSLHQRYAVFFVPSNLTSPELTGAAWLTGWPFVFSLPKISVNFQSPGFCRKSVAQKERKKLCK